MASNLTSISRFISTAKDLDDLQYIENYFTSHSMTPLSLEKNALCDLQRLYDSVFNTPVPNLDHHKGFLGFVKCLQQFSFETDDGLWQPEHENFMCLINKSMNYLSANFGKGDPLNDSFDIILNIIINTSKYHQTLKTKMLHSLSPVIFNIIIKNALPLDLLKKCLTALTNLVTRSELVKRKEVMELVYPKLCRFFDQLYACGDFDTQLCIVETLLRYIVPDKNRKLFFFHFKQKDPELIKNFLNIRSRDFDVDCRLFLNYINKCQGESALVQSVPCLTVLLDDIRIEKPPEQELFWIDFNKRSLSVSIWCNKNSLLTADEQKITEYSYATDWQSIVIYPDIVTEVSVKSSLSQSSQQQSFKEVIFFLKGNIIIRPLSNIKSSKSKRIHIIFPKSRTTEDLENKILPQLFHMQKLNNDELVNKQANSLVIHSRSRGNSRRVSEVKTTVSLNVQSKLPVNDKSRRNVSDGSCSENKIQIRRRRKVSSVKTTIEFQSCLEQTSRQEESSICTKSNPLSPAGGYQGDEDILIKLRDSNNKTTGSLPRDIHQNFSQGDDTVPSKSSYKSTVQLDPPEKSNSSSKVLKNKFTDNLNRRIKMSESVDKCSINISNNNSDTDDIKVNGENSNNLAVNKQNENLESQKESITLEKTNLIPETFNENDSSNFNKISNVEDGIIMEDDKSSFELPNQSQIIQSKRRSGRCTYSVKKNKCIADNLLKEMICSTHDGEKHKENIHHKSEINKNNSEQNLVSSSGSIPKNNLCSLGTCVSNTSDISQNNILNTCEVLNKSYLLNVDTQENKLLKTDRKTSCNNKSEEKGHNITDENVTLRAGKNGRTYPDNRTINEVNEFGKSNPTALGRHDNVPLIHKSMGNSLSLSKNLVNFNSSVTEMNNDIGKNTEVSTNNEFSHESTIKNQIQSKENQNKAKEIRSQRKRNQISINDSLTESQTFKCSKSIVNSETMPEEEGKRSLRSSNKSRKKPLDIITKAIAKNQTDGSYENKENIKKNSLKNYNDEEIEQLKNNKNIDIEQSKDLIPVKSNKRKKSQNSKIKNSGIEEGEQKLENNEDEIIPNLKRSNRGEKNKVKLSKEESHKTKVQVSKNNERETFCQENKLQNEIFISSDGKSVVQCETKSKQIKDVIVNATDKHDDHKNSSEPCETLTEDKKSYTDKKARQLNAQCSNEKTSKKLHDLNENFCKEKPSNSSTVTNSKSVIEFEANQKDFVTKQIMGSSNCEYQQEAIENIPNSEEHSFSNRVKNVNNNTPNLAKTAFDELENLCLNDRLNHLKSKESNCRNNDIYGVDSRFSNSKRTIRETPSCKNIEKIENIEEIVDPMFVSKCNTLDIACEKQDESNVINADMVADLNDRVKTNIIDEEKFSTKKDELHTNSFSNNAVHVVTKAIVHANPDHSVPSSEEQSSNNKVSKVITTSVQVFKYFSQSVMSVEKTVGKKSKSSQDCNSHQTMRTNVGDKNKTVTEKALTNNEETLKPLSSTQDSMNDFKLHKNVYISNKKVRTKCTDKVTNTQKKGKSLCKQNTSKASLNRNSEKNQNNETFSSARSLRKRKAVSYVFDSPINDLPSPILKREKYSEKEKKTNTNTEDKSRRPSVKRKLFTQNQVDIISLCSASQSSTTTINYQEPTTAEKGKISLNEPQSKRNKSLDEFDMVLASSLPPLPKKFNRWEEKYRKEKKSLISTDRSKSEAGNSNKRKHSIYSDLETDSDASFSLFKTTSITVTNNDKVTSHIIPTENDNNEELKANERVGQSETNTPNIRSSPCSSPEKLLCSRLSYSPGADVSFLNIESNQSKECEKFIEKTGKNYVQDDKLLINTNDISEEKVQDNGSDKNDYEAIGHISVQTPATNVIELNNAGVEKLLKEISVHRSEKCSTKHKKSTLKKNVYSNNDAISHTIGKSKNMNTRIDHEEKSCNIILDNFNGCRKEEDSDVTIDGKERQTILQKRKLPDPLLSAKQIGINNNEDILKDSRSNMKRVVTEGTSSVTTCRRGENNQNLLQNCDDEVASDVYESFTNNQNNNDDDRYSPNVSKNYTPKEFGNHMEHFENKETIKCINICESYKVNNTKRNKTSLDSLGNDNIIRNETKIQTNIEKQHKRSECFNVKDFKSAFHVNSRSDVNLNMQFQSSEIAENCSYSIPNHEHNLEEKNCSKTFKNSNDILLSQKNIHTEQNIYLSSSQNRKIKVNTVENTKKVISKVKQTVKQTHSQMSGTFVSDEKLICSSSVSSSESSGNPEDPAASSEEECTTQIQPYTSGSKSLKDQFQKMVYEKMKYINAVSNYTSNTLLTQLSNSSSLFVKERTSYIKALDDVFVSNIKDIQTQLKSLEEYEQFLEQKKAEMIAMISRQKLNSEEMIKSQSNIQQAYGSFLSDSRFKQHFDIQQLLSSMKESYMKKTLRDMLQKCRNVFDISP